MEGADTKRVKDFSKKTQKMPFWKCRAQYYIRAYKNDVRLYLFTSGSSGSRLL
jgi:hypothetical protein